MEIFAGLSRHILPWAGRPFPVAPGRRNANAGVMRGAGVWKERNWRWANYLRRQTTGWRLLGCANIAFRGRLSAIRVAKHTSGNVAINIDQNIE